MTIEDVLRFAVGYDVGSQRSLKQLTDYDRDRSRSVICGVYARVSAFECWCYKFGFTGRGHTDENEIQRFVRKKALSPYRSTGNRKIQTGSRNLLKKFWEYG